MSKNLLPSTEIQPKKFFTVTQNKIDRGEVASAQNRYQNQNRRYNPLYNKNHDDDTKRVPIFFEERYFLGIAKLGIKNMMMSVGRTH